VDGAIVRNNPVRVALEEDKRLWGVENRPDIVVSIGTGISVEANGCTRPNRRSKHESWSWMLRGRLKKMVDTGFDMIASTLDCQREWQDVVRSNPKLAGRCHRLDVGIFDDKLPELDDVSKMEELENLSDEYFARESPTGQKYFNRTYGSAYQHLRVVARQLLAALFYTSHRLGDHNEARPQRLSGYIHCRLTPTSPGALTLVRDVRFRLRECRVPSSDVDRPNISKISFTKTSEGRSFDHITLAAPVEFVVSPGSWRRSIEASFPSSGDRGWATISGF
jgi:hypothetical protein